GDAFKNRPPTPTFLREFAARARDLSALAPTVLLVGNHDLPQTVRKASSIEVFDTLKVPNVWVADQFEGRVIDTKRGPVYVAAAPFPMRSHVLTEEDGAGKSIADVNLALEIRVSEYLAWLAGEAAAHNMPRLLAGHFTISGATVQRSSERMIMMGHDVEIMLSNVAPENVWDYVAMGHVHKHQNVTHERPGMPPVVYSGSLERIDFGEENDPKGFVWLELERGKAEWSFVPVAARPFVTLRADLRESDDPTADALDLIRKHNLDQAVVRMLLELTPETANRLNEKTLRDALHEAGADSTGGIQKAIEQAARTRLGSSPEGLTDMQLLDTFLKSKQVLEGRRVQLTEAARPLLDPTTGDSRVSS
ncbi:MAG TPA: hypothetical protein VER79_02515, partial [Candidatus Limnocylindrales bacterium]|nr:hypothetical protein [Candidatus Limnocylindrales bacterium]